MTMELLGTIGIIALIAAMVGAYIALMVWDWRKKRTQARPEAVAEAWGEAFEVLAHHAPPKSSAKEAASAREIIRQNGQCNGVSCDYCPIGQDKCQLITPSGPVEARMMPWADAARAWLTERGIPVEAPEVGEAH